LIIHVFSYELLDEGGFGFAQTSDFQSPPDVIWRERGERGEDYSINLLPQSKSPSHSNHTTHKPLNQ